MQYDEAARQKFQQADALYRSGEYAQAIQLLEELNKQFPNERNIIFPLAFAYAAAGRIDQAQAARQYLATNFQDQRQQSLDQYVSQCASTAAQQQVQPQSLENDLGVDLGIPNLDGMDANIPGMGDPLGDVGGDPLAAFDLGGSSSSAATGGSTKPVYRGPVDDTLVWKIVLAVAILLFTGYGVVTSLYSPMSPEDLAGVVTPEYQQQYIDNWRAWYAAYSLITTPLIMFISPLPLYLVLRATDNLPYGLFWKDYFSAYAYSLSIYIGYAFCCIGCLVGYYLTNRRYELGFGGLVFLNLSIGLYLLFQALLFVGFLVAFFSFVGIPLDAFVPMNPYDYGAQPQFQL